MAAHAFATTRFCYGVILTEYVEIIEERIVFHGITLKFVDNYLTSSHSFETEALIMLHSISSVG